MHNLTIESIDAFLNHQKSIGVSEKSISTDKSRLKRLYKWLGDDKQVTLENILLWRENLEASGCSAASQSSYVSSLNRYLKFIGEPEVRLPQRNNNIKDISGQVFGCLTAITPTEKRANGSVVWKCKCQCGNEIDVAALSLKRGLIYSCGCQKREHYETKDLTGLVFGRLTAIEPTEKRKRGYIVWKCKCQCGKEVEVETGLLTSGGTKSCGCWRSERLTIVNHYIDGTSLAHSLSVREKSKNSKSGYVGVFEDDGKWVACIYYKKKQYYLGRFDKLEDAVDARRLAKERIRQDALSLERKYNELHNSDS